MNTYIYVLSVRFIFNCSHFVLSEWLSLKRIPPKSQLSLHARSSKLADVSNSLSGGGEGVRRQLVDEMKATDKRVRERILKEAGITPEITAREGVAMKAELALLWRKRRHLRRCILLG